VRNHDPFAAIRSRAWPLVGLLAALALGPPACSSQGDNGGPMSPQITAMLFFSPDDGSTAQSTGAVDLVLSSGAVSIVTQTLLSDVAGRVVFQTWPEGDAVPFGTTLGDGPAAGQMRVTVTPQAALDDRWYLVKLGSVPSMVLPEARLEDGSAGTRFRPGSHPRVASIQICRNDASSGKLLVTFSEAVTFAGPTEGIVSLSIAGSPSTCMQYGSQGDTLLFTCGLLAGAETATIAVGAGVSGATGVAEDPGSWTLGVTGTPGNCVELRPPLP
jgi:hypothetical protein